MELHCALKAAKHLFKNKDYYHHNANDRFGFNATYGPKIDICIYFESFEVGNQHQLKLKVCFFLSFKYFFHKIFGKVVFFF